MAFSRTLSADSNEPEYAVLIYNESPFSMTNFPARGFIDSFGGIDPLFNKVACARDPLFITKTSISCMLLVTFVICDDSTIVDTSRL